MKPNVAKAKSKRGGAREGAGRKPSHVEADLQALMDTAWSQDMRIAVVRALHESAINGNVQAATALLDRALGKPVERQIAQTEADDRLHISVEYADPEPRDE
jgi:hypothetical protein